MNPCLADRHWQIVIDGQGDALWNMALDEAILDGVMNNTLPPTVRFYRWQRPALTVGRFQNIARTINQKACAAEEIPLVRRLTGGRGILHGADLTISIVCAVTDLGIAKQGTTTRHIYDHTAQWFIRALRECGIFACVGSGTTLRGQDRIGNCFDVACCADVVETQSNRKVLGSALYRRGDFVLQQISIPVKSAARNANLVARVFYGHQTQVDNEAHVTVDLIEPDPLQTSIVAVLRQVHFDIETTSCDAIVQSRAHSLIRSRYSRTSWNFDGEVEMAR